MGSDEQQQSLIDQAATWLVALDTGSADRAAFEEWRGRSSRHAAAFAQAAAIWSRTADLRHVAEAPAPAQAPRHAPTDAPVHAPIEAGERRGIDRRSLIAAAVVGAVAIAGGGAWLTRDTRELVETAVGKRRSLMLPDGSIAELNSDTRLLWRYGTERALWMERGECALDVAPQAAPPLRVSGPDFVAGLAAGRYNLQLSAGGAVLAVLAGTARVALGAGGAHAVAAGNRLTWNDARATLAPLSEAAVARITAWQRGEILFDGMTLGEAVAEFNRYLPRKLVVADRDTAAIALGGRYMIDEPEAFLRALRDGFGVASQAQGDIIKLSR